MLNINRLEDIQSYSHLSNFNCYAITFRKIKSFFAQTVTLNETSYL